MPDSFVSLLIILVVFALITAFIRARKIDKCLKDFINDPVCLEMTDGTKIKGKLFAATTGVELCYKEKQVGENKIEKTSFMIYKPEYVNIQALARFYDDLNDKEKKIREKRIKKTYHPGFFRRMKRKIQNIFKIVKDSLIELIDLIIGHAKRVSPLGKMGGPQEKYISKLKEEYVSSVYNSYEPLLERHIGKKVVLEMNRNDKIIEYVGILKDYTSEFVEIFDVDYNNGQDEKSREADLVIPRRVGTVRNLGE
ncbi:MAG: hypothetical protein ACOC5R_04720 [Elusimicrobiota bacterium]